MTSRRQTRRVADEAFERLGEESKRVISNRGEAKAWHNLVKLVGPELAVEYVEVSSLIGMVDAVEATFDLAMKDFAREGDATSTSAAIRAVHDGFKDRVTKQALVAMDAANSTAETLDVIESSSAEATLVANEGLHYFFDMFESAERLLSEGMDDMEVGEWTRRKWAWYDMCDKWDRASGRRNLPLIGDRS